VEHLPAVRFEPPSDAGWFVELLTIPESPSEKGENWTRLETTARSAT
jgi:hypothetical protein